MESDQCKKLVLYFRSLDVMYFTVAITIAIWKGLTRAECIVRCELLLNAESTVLLVLS